ncbi:MAG: hypothetical protein KIS61_02085 [Candidatus Eremiobacteraeota bacterium]|nr:hypothetical protein [Candidatus Eremiobacteraeota bacterium]
MNKWRVFAPPEDWRRPIEIEESQPPLLMTVAEQLACARVGRDDAQSSSWVSLRVPGRELPALAKE